MRCSILQGHLVEQCCIAMSSLFTEPAVGTLFGREELRAIERVLREGGPLTRGKDIEAFEEEFAAYCQAPHAVAVSSGSAALRIAAQLLRIGKGDEVIVPANAFWNTVAALVERQAVLRIADVDGYTLAPDPAIIESLITKKTKAIVILSFGGHPCDMTRLLSVAAKHHIPLVEDAAHSVGASHRGRRVGSFCDLTCFSFASLKNMSTLGEGGMLVMRHRKYASEAAKLRESWPIGKQIKRRAQGFGPYPRPSDLSFMRPGDAFDADWTALEEVGTNCKMTSVAAAVGRVQLKKVDRFNAMRRSLAEQYDAALQHIPGVRFREQYARTKSSWHLYNFFLTQESGIDRDALVQELKSRHGIQLIHRFWPIHLHSVLRMQGHRPGEAPVYERLWFRELMSLPIAPSMDKERVAWVLEKVCEVSHALSRT